MMLNSTQISYFILAAYINMGLFKYFLFLFVLCLYVVIVCSNLLLIVVICMNRSLHEPMYIFLCNLFVNELFGSTALFPFLLLHILSDIHTVSASLCFLQIFCVYTYVCVEFSNLAAMSYDRYLAICCPLQYHACMTTKKVSMLIVMSWLCSFVSMLVLISLSAPLQLCGNVINKVYCGNYAVVKLACSDTSLHNIYGLINTVFSVIFPLVLIIVSYMKILKVCFSECRHVRQKAISTCSPHLASLINFSFGCCFQIIQNRFDISTTRNILSIILSLYLACQPLCTPLVYGLQMSKIRALCKRLM